MSTGSARGPPIRSRRAASRVICSTSGGRSSGLASAMASRSESSSRSMSAAPVRSPAASPSPRATRASTRASRRSSSSMMRAAAVPGSMSFSMVGGREKENLTTTNRCAPGPNMDRFPREPMARIQPLTDPLHRWSVADSLELYSIERWSSGYFSINPDGNIIVTPRGRDRGSVDLKALVDELQRRGIQLPLLIRFSDILRSRIELLNRAFAQAIADMSYQGVYRGVYPIKVNQSRVVVEEIVDYGRPFHYGLEAGSKPELLAVMALHRDEQALVVCNGYK